eukprot:gb/GECH01003667.1/.p1 GENE.gb/GECH01003667.1/~~gb/GECH01003667.1/.p1  ORF type:complete len:426 (+),score=131.99 gb/GECH01003667.1/:1-1278(+)
MSSKPKNKLLTLHQLVPYLFYSRDYICQKLLLSDIDFQHLCSRHGIISWPSEMLDELQHSIIHNMHRIPPEELDTLVENKITTCLNECILTSHISQEMIMSVFRQLSHRIHVQYAQQQNQKQQRQQQQKQQESSSSSLSSASVCSSGITLDYCYIPPEHPSHIVQLCPQYTFLATNDTSPHHYHHHRQFPHLLFQPFQNRSTPPRCFNSPPLRRFRGKKIARAMMFKENGNLNKSEKILKKILTWNNNRPLVHFKLACVLSLQDRPKEALDEIKEALKTGFDKIDSIYEEKDLEAVRNLPNFEKQIKKIMNRNSKKNCSMKKSTGSKKKKNEELDEKDSLSSSGEDIDRNESKEYEHKSPQDTVQEHYPSPSAPPAEIMIGRVQSKYPKEMEMLHEMGLTDSEKNMLALERNQGVIAKALKEIIS